MDSQLEVPRTRWHLWVLVEVSPCTLGESEKDFLDLAGAPRGDGGRRDERKTLLLSKKGDPQHAGNYRPITCMNTITKVFTSILKRKMEKRLHEEGNFLSPSQFGARPGTLAPKEALMISTWHKKTLSKRKKKCIEMHSDMAKAYDRVMHRKLLETLQKKGIQKDIICVVKRMLETTSLELNCGGEGVGEVKVKEETSRETVSLPSCSSFRLMTSQSDSTERLS